MNRRKFLTGSLVAGAATLSGTRIGNRGLEIGREAAAATPHTPYPVLLIMLRGGLDPAMHLVATPNGAYKSGVNIRHRMSGTSAIKQVTGKAGGQFRYFTGSVASTGNAQFEQHIPDISLLRAFAASASHYHLSAPWFGKFDDLSNINRKPWANLLASAFRKAGAFVPKPVAIARPRDIGPFRNTPWMDFEEFSNFSPDPSVAAEGILSFNGFFDSLAAPNLSPFARREPSYALGRALDGMTYSAAQADIKAAFEASTSNADNVMKSLSAPAWPAPPEVLSALGLTAASFTARGPSTAFVRRGPNLALAFQALRHNLSHVLAFVDGGYQGSFRGYDTHMLNYERQMAIGQGLWSDLGRMLTLMKATPSPIVPGKSLFDTTNIWVQSEMGRAPGPDTSGPDIEGGTAHWDTGCALFMGGRFKRGAAIGEHTSRWKASPINPVTGATTSSGSIMNFDNTIATVLKAAGIDPALYTNAAPIDALLDMSA